MLAAACGGPEGPPISISGVVILEPLPGSGVAVGYLDISNGSELPITISRVTSTNFSNIEIHETVIRDEVAKMISLAQVEVEAKSTISFEPGGKHLMMFGAAANIVAGSSVELQFHDATNGLVTFTTTVQSRRDFQD
jgi:copper(I)-binding protein